MLSYATSPKKESLEGPVAGDAAKVGIENSGRQELFAATPEALRYDGWARTVFAAAQDAVATIDGAEAEAHAKDDDNLWAYGMHASIATGATEMRQSVGTAASVAISAISTLSEAAQDSEAGLEAAQAVAQGASARMQQGVSAGTGALLAEADKAGEKLGNAMLAAVAGGAVFALVAGAIVLTAGAATPLVLIGAGILGGAASGAASTFTDGALSGQEKTGKDYAAATAMGALVGGVTAGIGALPLSAALKGVATGVGIGASDQAIDMTLKGERFNLPEFLVSALVATILSATVRKLVSERITAPGEVKLKQSGRFTRFIDAAQRLAHPESTGKPAGDTSAWLTKQVAKVPGKAAEKSVENQSWMLLSQVGIEKDPDTAPKSP